MPTIIGLSLGLILAGLVMAWLAGSLRQSVLAGIVYWVDVALVVVGLILLLTPVIVWLNVQIRAMLEVR